jgi:hypothetical protein
MRVMVAVEQLSTIDLDNSTSNQSTPGLGFKIIFKPRRAVDRMVHIDAGAGNADLPAIGKDTRRCRGSPAPSRHPARHELTI